MGEKIRRIGVLTSGGDAPGMNAAIRAVTRTAISKGIEVIGIRHGYSGLLSEETQALDILSVSGILNEGGSMLCSARSPEFREDAGVDKGRAICQKLGLNGLVVIGGDGSFRGARDLSQKGIPCIGIPGTIDNDISCTEYTLGFDTAIGTVVEMAERLRSTSQSHDRCNLIEVMGQRAGDLALHAGIACGAIAILLPEVTFELARVVNTMAQTRKAGKQHFLIIVSEGVTATKNSRAMTVHDMAAEIERLSGVVSRATELGYVQRGGSPSPRDRIVATEMGYLAVQLLGNGIGNRVIVSQNNRILDMDILEGLQMTKKFDRRLYEAAHAVSI